MPGHVAVADRYFGAVAWASIAGGYEPRIGGAVNVIRTALEAQFAKQWS